MLKGLLILLLSIFLLFSCSKKNNEELVSEPSEEELVLDIYAEAVDALKKGDVFLSLRNQSMIMLYRPSTDEVVWFKAGPYMQQHDVDIINDHQISIFNNNAIHTYRGDIVDGNNEVMIYDFKTDKLSKHLEESLNKLQVRSV